MRRRDEEVYRRTNNRTDGGIQREASRDEIEARTEE